MTDPKLKTRLDSICTELQMEFPYEEISSALVARGIHRMTELGGVNFALANLNSLTHTLKTIVATDEKATHNRH
jgi:hypothetical protein